MTKRTSKTAEELMAELTADPEFVARQLEREQAQSQMAADLRREAGLLIADLKNVGVDVESVWDLVGNTGSHPRAVPILIAHLQRPYSSRLREGIARALAVPDAVTVWGALVPLFEEEARPSAIDVKWAVGCAIAAAANDDVIGDVIRLFQDRRHGAQRVALISALARSPDPRARQAMTAAANDPDLAFELRKTLSSRVTRTSVPKAAGAARGDVEASANFDAAQVGLFLGHIAGFVRGFEKRDIEKVARSVGDLDVDDECEFTFTVIHAGRTVPMRICIVMDDADSPDVYFFTTADLAREIDQALRDFFDEHGM